MSNEYVITAESNVDEVEDIFDIVFRRHFEEN